MTITSAAPTFNLTGIEDLSRRPLLPEAEALPMHLPHVHILANRGPTVPHLAVGAELTRLYGAQTFDMRGPYANQATVMATTFNGQGNALMVQRILGDGALQARLRLLCEVVAADIPQYERNADGTFRLDTENQKIPTGATVPGHRVRWSVEPMESSEQLGAATPRAGSLSGSEGETSTIYPVMEIPAHWFGDYGNNLGFRLYAPTTNSTTPVDDEVIVDQNAYLYRLQIVERPDRNSSPQVQQTLTGGQFVEFALPDGIINRKVDTELSFNRVVHAAFTDTDTTSGFPPAYGPFGEIELYSDNVDAITRAVFLAETQSLSAEGGLPYREHAMNIMGGVDFDGVPYQSVEMVGPADGGILLSETATHYLTSGSDGDLSWETFDRNVGNDVANYENSEFNLMDDALYPHTAFWDPGYSIETKRKLLTPIGLRKDVYVVLSTQDVTQSPNTVEEDSSVAIALRNAARMFPESALFGTSVCRAIVVGHAGYLPQSNFNGLVPMTRDLALKVADYMGPSNGIMRAGFGFDDSPRNQINGIIGVNNTYKPARVRNRDWANGLVWAQNYDRRSLFYPAVQTVYDDDTSVLNSAITMMIAVELQKVCQRVWRDLTGNSRLTNAQFIERSNALITERTAGRFDGRVVIVPETFLTPEDTARGYSWSCRINMYANNMKTVGTFTVVARRREELE